MSTKAKSTPSKSSNKSVTTTKPTPKSGSPNKNAAKSGTTNAQTAKSGKTSTPAKDDTIHELQKELDACRLQNAMLRARFNPEKIREELQKEQIVTQDQNELFRTQIRELMEENHTLKSGSNQQDSKELDLLKENNKQLEKTLKEANEKLAQSAPRVKALEDMKRTLEKEKMELTQKIEEMKKERDHQSKKSSDSANGEVTKLKSPLKEIEKQKEELESEVQSLRSRTKSLEDINKILEKEKGDMTKKIEDLQQERDHLSKTRAGQKNTSDNEEALQIQTLEADNKKLTIELRESKEHLTKSLDDLQSAKLDKDSAEKDKEQKDVELKKAIQRIQELEKENKGISEELHNKKTEIENLQDELKRLSDSATDKTGLEQLQQEVVQLKQEQEESRKHKSRIKELEGKCHDAFVDLERKGKEMKKLKDEHQVLIERKDKSSIEKLQDEKRKHESRIKELEGKCHDAFVDLERKGKEMKKLKDEHQGMIERKDKTIEELRKKSNMVDPMSPSSNIKEIEDERDELRKRLSEIISGKMTTNKPDIADLSDEFRPSKLGEMYSELYDNEWTDAFEEVESARGSEKAAIEYLLQILQEANSFIQKTATQYWEQAFKGILSFNGQVGEIKEDQLPGIVKKHLVDLLKKTSPYLKDIVGTVFVKQSKGQGEKEKLFRRHCAELCWMMRMQDPPVVLGSSTLSGNFNTSMYKEYTKRGSTVDFIVWPPLHLYENGPILSKGVAQGK